MAGYLLIESRDPFESNDVSYYCDLARGLAEAGNQVTLFLVQNAVLASPKLSDPEVEMFASAKHVSENVLREIARSRRFMKNYSVVRNLVNNPRCPLDLSLTLVKNLLVYDLKSLRQSKNISETIRRVADKLYKDKVESRKGVQG